VGVTLLAGLLFSAPIVLINPNSPFFAPAIDAAAVVIVAGIVGFAIYAKRWTYPGA